MEDGRLSTRRPARSSCRNGSVGFRWGEKGKWNLEEKDVAAASETRLRLSLDDIKDELADVGFPYFGNREHDHFAGTDHPDVLVRNVPAKTRAADGRRGAGRHGVRPVRRQLRRRPRLRRRATSPRPTTTTCPTRRPGRRRSPACRATRSSRWRASSRATPRRPTAGRW